MLAGEYFTHPSTKLCPVRQVFVGLRMTTAANEALDAAFHVHSKTQGFYVPPRLFADVVVRGNTRDSVCATEVFFI